MSAIIATGIVMPIAILAEVLNPPSAAEPAAPDGGVVEEPLVADDDVTEALSAVASGRLDAEPIDDSEAVAEPVEDWVRSEARQAILTLYAFRPSVVAADTIRITPETRIGEATRRDPVQPRAADSLRFCRRGAEDDEIRTCDRVALGTV
ncbi:hypothetical protein TruAng_009896 [Truncatella angustata]|nr:hypothetical protein TruAng_009896 [Truncatella angustata]